MTTMEKYLTNESKTKLKGLAFYQIVGGVIGIGVVVWLIAQTETITGIIISIVALAGGLFCFSFYCGLQLLKGNVKSGLKLSTINQALQAVNFTLFGFGFMFVSGLMLSVGVDYTTDFKFTFNFSLSEFQINVNSDSDLVTIGVNFIAIYAIYFIKKLQQEVEMNEAVFMAQSTVDNSDTLIAHDNRSLN